MKKILFPALLSLLPFYLSAQLRKPSAADQTESIIADENSRLDASFAMHGDVWISDQSVNQADPKTGVIINVADLKKYFELGQITDIRQGIRLVLAHERAHLYQYQTYGYDKLQHSGAAFQRVLECQADIMAGKIFLESLEPMIVAAMESGNGWRDPDVKLAEENALNLMMVLGEATYAQGTHPSKEQRRMAIKLGETAGLVDVQYRYLQSHSGSLSADDISAIKNFINQENKAANRISGETATPWSLRQAKRIVDEQVKDAKNIVFEITKQDWNRNGNDPYVDYGITVTNNGSSTLVVDFGINTEKVDRKDPGNTLRSAVFDAANYKLTLGPGQQQAVSGRLNWNFFGPGQQLPDYMPQLIRPTDPGSLIYVEELNDPEIPDEGNGRFGNLQLGGLKYKELENVPLIMERIRAYKDSVSHLIAGPGFEFNTGQNNLPLEIGYPCFNSYSHITLYQPVAETPRPWLQYIFSQDADKDQINADYQQLIAKLNNAYQDELTSDGMANDHVDKDTGALFRRYILKYGFMFDVKIVPPDQDSQLWTCAINVRGVKN